MILNLESLRRTDCSLKLPLSLLPGPEALQMTQRNRGSRLPAPTSPVLQQAAPRTRNYSLFSSCCLAVCKTCPVSFLAESVEAFALQQPAAQQLRTAHCRRRKLDKACLPFVLCRFTSRVVTCYRSNYPQRARVRTAQSLSEQVFRSNHAPLPVVRQKGCKIHALEGFWIYGVTVS